MKSNNMKSKDRLNKRSIGSLGELRAREFLVRNGYEIIDFNFRFSKFGEVDIIARDGEFLCFIEVKSRSSNLYGTPAEAVSIKKQSYIKNLANIYLKRYNSQDINIRFDIVEIYFNKSLDGIDIKSINLIKNAF